MEQFIQIISSESQGDDLGGSVHFYGLTNTGKIFERYKVREKTGEENEYGNKTYKYVAYWKVIDLPNFKDND